MVERLRRPRAAAASRRGRSTPTRCPSCGTSGRSATTGRRCPDAARLQGADPRPARAPAARATTGSRRPRTSPTRSSGRRPGGSTPRGLRARRPPRRAASRRSRSTCSCAPSTATSARRRGPGRIDFDDLLVGTVDLLEGDADAAATVRARKRWFSVDEYQDTSPLQQRLLELWLGESRDLCVVGDEDQTIYTFTGATSDVPHLVRRALAGGAGGSARPELPLDAAGAGARQPADRGGGPRRSGWWRPAATARSPRSRATRRRSAELAALVAGIRARLGGGHRAGGGRGPRPDERPARADRGGAHAGGHRVPGPRACGSTTGRRCAAAVQAAAPAGARRARGPALAAAIRRALDGRAWATRRTATAEGDEARERQASLETLLAIVDELAPRRPARRCGRRSLAELEARAAHERDGLRGRREPAHATTARRASSGTPCSCRRLEEGILPIRQAKDDEDGARRGAPAALRGHHPGADAPRAVVGGAARDRAAARHGASRAGSCSTSGRARRPGHGSASCPGRRSRARRRSPRAGGDPDDPLFAALRAWRTGRRARTRRCRPYVIAHDATLRGDRRGQARGRSRRCGG